MSVKKNPMQNYSLLFLILILLSCQEPAVTNFSLVSIPTPCQAGGEANLFTSAEGLTYLSWVEQLDDSTDALQFARLEKDHWSKAATIAQGNNWFVNWADFPSLAVTKNGQYLAAHWLQKSAAGTYDYDVHISTSKDAGANWSESFIPHRDSIAAEHGFVTMMPYGKSTFFATWLDGRHTKTGAEETDEHGHGGGAMSLRAAVFDLNQNLSEAIELDHRICDCCQTDAVLTPNGPVVVYRDRSEEEIRDISIVRKVDQDWTKPRTVFQDHWKISGCPVNGPAVASADQQLAVAWFTAAQEQPKVQVILSKDAGATFSKPIAIDQGQPLGRVDLVFLNNKLYLTWLEQHDDAAAIMLAVIDIPSQTVLNRQVLVQTSAARQSGFPILENSAQGLLLAWTAVQGEQTVVRTGFLREE